jgi:hypothetical protein
MTSFQWWKRHSPTKLELNSFIVFKIWELIPFNPARNFFGMIWNDQQNKVGAEETYTKFVVLQLWQLNTFNPVWSFWITQCGVFESQMDKKPSMCLYNV